MREPAIPIGSGLRLVPSPHMSDVTEDWSKVRSPGRAKRRRKAGKPQRIVRMVTPHETAMIDHASGTVYAHPDVLQKLRVRLDEEKALDRNLSVSPLPDPRQSEIDLFAHAHIGVWGYEAAQAGGRRNFRHKAFDRFPDLMGGDLAQLAIYSSAELYGPHVLWELPREMSFANMGAVPTAVDVSFATVVFRVERMGFEGRAKDVLCFADEGSEARFRRHLLDLRRAAAHDDLRWGFTKLDLSPKRGMAANMGEARGRMW